MAPGPGNEAIAWHALGLPAIVSLLVTNPASGLTNKAAEDRRSLCGQTLPRIAQPKAVFREGIQFGITVALSFLSVVTALLRLWADCLTLAGLLVLSLVPFPFRHRRTGAAASTLRALKRRQVLTLRDAHLVKIAPSKLVPGDIIIVVAGDIVPADARLLNARSLWCSANPVCGGPFPLIKFPGMLTAGTPLRRRHNMIHMGTRVLHGSGRAIVVATGNSATLFLPEKSHRRGKSRRFSATIGQAPPLPASSKQ